MLYAAGMRLTHHRVLGQLSRPGKPGLQLPAGGRGLPAGARPGQRRAGRAATARQPVRHRRGRPEPPARRPLPGHGAGTGSPAATAPDGPQPAIPVHAPDAAAHGSPWPTGRSAAAGLGPGHGRGVQLPRAAPGTAVDRPVRGHHRADEPPGRDLRLPRRAGGRALAYSADTGPATPWSTWPATPTCCCARPPFLDGADLPPDLHLTGTSGRPSTRPGPEPGTWSLTHLAPGTDEASARSPRPARLRRRARLSLAASGQTFELAAGGPDSPLLSDSVVWRAWPDPTDVPRPTLRPVTHHPGLARPRRGSVLVEFGATRVLCAAQRHRGRAALAQGQRAGLGDRRVRDAAARDQHPQRPRVGQGPHRRPHPRDLPAGRPLAARRRSTTRRWARTPSSSTATCCRPTAAPAPRRSPAPTSRWPTRSPTCAAEERLPGDPLITSGGGGQRGHHRRRAAARPGYDEDVRGRDRHERRLHRRRASSSRCRAPPRASRSTAIELTRCSTWP